MGMSASQARLLSITSRLTNNEFRAQTITNSKLRLATESQEASQKYMDALTSKKLVFGQYDVNGDKTYTPLTANVLLSYGDLKNQYAMVNTNGQILLSGSDIKTYMAANSDYNEYMRLNGVNMLTVDNDEYAEQLQTILGAEWAEYLTAVDVTTVGDVQNKLVDYLNRINTVANTIYNKFGTIPNNTAGYNNIVSGISSTVTDKSSGIYDLLQAGGITGDYINTITNPPAYTIGDEPTWTEPNKPSTPDFASLVAAYNGQQCHSAVANTHDGIGHMEHNLSALLWGKNGIFNGDKTINNSANTITVTANDPREDYVSLTNFQFGYTNSSAALSEALNTFSEYQCVKDAKQSIINLYCDVVNTLHQNGCVGSASTELGSARYSITSNAAACSNSDLVNRWNQMYTDLSALQGKLDAEIDATFQEYRDKLDQEYESKHKTWQNGYDALCEKVAKWRGSFADLATKVQNAIKALGEATKEIPDEKDAKFQWYKNLWNRMGEGRKVGSEIDKSNFVELDENLINNSEWLKFALEHGIITLEQATFFEDGSVKYPNMGQYDWISKSYTSAVDIVSQDDEVAIAIAEVKYKNTVTEIENKDKKYDQDLKKLDTEHNALQTEYESIKEVVTKNVERSFKAFS